MENLISPLADCSALMDLGAGTGLVADLTEPFFYAAVDQSEAMLQELSGKHPGAFTVLTDLNTEAGITHLAKQVEPLKPFDLVTSLWTAHYIHQQGVYEMMLESLASGGTVLFHGNFPRRKARREPPAGSDDKEWDPLFTPKTLKAALLKAGFTDVKVRGMNAIPDWVTEHLPYWAAKKIMKWSQYIPARFHYHGAGIGRKP